MATSKTKVYTLGQVAREIGCSYRQVRRYVQWGDLAAKNTAAPGEKPRWQVSTQALTALRKKLA